MVKARTSVAQNRWAAVSTMLAQNNIEALVVHGAPLVGSYGNFTYLTGASPAPKGSVAVLRTGGAPIILHERGDATWRGTPRYYDGVEVHATDDVRSYAVKGADRPTGLIGVAGGTIGAHWPAGAVNVNAELAIIRQTVSSEELAELNSTVALAQSAIGEVCETLRPGVNERSVAAALTAAVISGGATMVLTHVAHADYCGQAPTARQLQPNELTTIVLEFADHNGFWVETGALFGWLGARRGAARMTADADALRRCLDAGQHLLGSGWPVREAGAAMTATLKDVGAFPIERLGHGVAVDEVPPDVSDTSTAVIRSGSVLALHPSLGREGTNRCAGLFRMLAVTDSGTEVLGAPDHADCVLR